MGLFGGFENQLIPSLVTGDQERTRYDKLLSKEEMMRVQQIMKKEAFKLEDVNELMTIANSTEPKLTRFDENERKVLGKFLNIWLGNFVKRYAKTLIAQEYFSTIESKMSERTKKLREDIVKMQTETFKQSLNSYFFGVRSPLSLEGSLIETLSANPQEMQYSVAPQGNSGIIQQQGWGNKK